MSAIIARQLYYNIVQRRQLVNVTHGISSALSQRPRHCHDNPYVSSEHQSKETTDKKEVKRKSSFHTLRRSEEHKPVDREEIKSNHQLNQDEKHFKWNKSEEEFKTEKNFKSHEDIISNSDNETFRRRRKDEFNGEKNWNNVKEFDGSKFSHQKSNKTEGRRKTDLNDQKTAHGSGRKYGQVYRSWVYPVKGEVLFGYHPVSIALSQGRRHCHKIFIQQKRKFSPDVDIIGMAEEAKIPVEEVSRIHLDQLCLGRPHQGICMDSDPLDVHQLTPDDIREAAVEPPPIWVLPYEIVDPMNMGAIMRSCYYFGVDTIVLPSQHSATASPMVSKASSGAMEVMKLFHLKNKTATQQFFQDWKANVGQIIGTAIGPDTVAVTDCVVTVPTLLIVGNEHHGLKKEILEHCDRVVKLKDFSSDRQPIIGSLNVSVATGIVLHALKTNGKDV